MSEVKRRGTIVLQARLDIRRVAEIAFYLKERGILLTHKSDILNASVNKMAESLTEQELVDSIETYEEAYKVMRLCGLDVFTDASNKSVKKHLAFQISHEDTDVLSDEKLLSAMKDAIAKRNQG